MAETFTQKASERLVYEEIVNVVVNMASESYKDDGEARLRIYSMVAENFAGMVKSLRKPKSTVLFEEHKKGEVSGND